MSTVISITELVEDLVLRDFEANDESLLVTSTDNLEPNEQPVVSIGAHKYKLGKIHPKTNKVVEMHNLKRVAGRFTPSQLADHIVSHAEAIDPKGPDIVDAFDEWVSEEGIDVGMSILSFMVFAVINRVPL